MHRVLFVSDVLLQVFIHFSQLESRNLLAALARTCRAFHEPAMYFLWAEIDGLRPLLGCVTRLHPMIYNNTEDPIWTHDRGIEPLSAQEACQFLRHAARVRSLRVTTDDNALFDPLTVLPNETCILPRLLSLSWRVSTPNSLYLRRFLSPMLRRCHLSGTLALHPDMKFIATSCPVLENLSIVPKTRALLTAHEYSLLSTTVRSCKRLVGLRCPPLDSAAWEHLSNLPTLVTVTIGDALREVHYPFDLENLNFAPFLNVTVLYLKWAAPSVTRDVITVMQHSEFPSLTSFKFRSGALPWADTEQLFCALSQCKAQHTLQDIVIACVISDDVLRDGFLPVIGHFFCFGQLRNLMIYIGAQIYLDNDLLLQATSSWPHIESLNIQCHGSPDRSPPVTFRGLFTALHPCSHLHTLQIPVDTWDIDIDPKFESFQHTSLRTLRLLSRKTPHTVTTDQAGAIARIIFSMFPRVYEVKDNFGVWGEINRHLKLLAREGQQT